MSQRTKIEWTEETANPYPGCQKISAGCEHCYAERRAKRLKAMGVPAYQDVVDEHGWTGKVGCNLKAMKVPGKGKMVFCQSMGDLFYGQVSDWDRDQVFARILEQPQHTFQILTKRPGNAGWYFMRGLRHPPANLWLGVTVENEDYLWRIQTLLEIPVAVRFVSLEPLLSAIDLSQWMPKLDLVIIGAETGPKRRPCKPEWVKSIVGQCHAAGVPPFVKAIHELGKGLPIVITDINRIANDLGYAPDELRQFPQRSRE